MCFWQLNKKRSSFVGAFVSTHGRSIDDVDKSILEAKTALSEVTKDLTERSQRWRQVLSSCPYKVFNLGYTYEPSTDPMKFELDEEDKEKLEIWKPETTTIREEDERTSESSDSEDKLKSKKNAPLLLFPSPQDFDRGRRRSSILEVHLIGQVCT